MSVSSVSPIRGDRKFSPVALHVEDDENLIRFNGRTHPCPSCGNSMARVRSRPMDRFIHLFHAVYRFKCQNKGCAWEGNLASERVIDEEIFI